MNRQTDSRWYRFRLSVWMHLFWCLECCWLSIKDMAWFLLGILVVTILLFLLSCRHASPVSEAMTNAESGVAAIVAHTDSAEHHVQAAIPESSPTGQVHLQSASDEHSFVLTEADDVSRELKQARADYAATYDDLTTLKAKWYVRWGIRIQRWFWIGLLTWGGLGIASVVLGAVSPLGLGFRISKEIVRFLPFMSPFAWIRDRYRRRT